MFLCKTALNGRQSPISLVSRKNNPKHYRHYFDGCFTSFANSANCDSLHESNCKIICHCEANRRFAEAIQRARI
ncbi:hypothetical protein [Helicobacter sp. 23-1045]